MRGSNKIVPRHKFGASIERSRIARSTVAPVISIMMGSSSNAAFDGCAESVQRGVVDYSQRSSKGGRLTNPQTNHS